MCNLFDYINIYKFILLLGNKSGIEEEWTCQCVSENLEKGKTMVNKSSNSFQMPFLLFKAII